MTLKRKIARKLVAHQRQLHKVFLKLSLEQQKIIASKIEAEREKADA